MPISGPRISSRIPLRTSLDTLPPLFPSNTLTFSTMPRLDSPASKLMSAKRSPAASYRTASHQRDSAYMPPPLPNPHVSAHYHTPGINIPPTSFEDGSQPFDPVLRKAMVEMNNERNPEDINSMFRRPEYQPIYSERVTAAGFRVIEGTTVPCPTEWQSHEVHDVSLPPQNQTSYPINITGSRKSVSKNEDVDRILAKYGKNNSKASVNSVENKDPDFASLTQHNSFRMETETYPISPGEEETGTEQQFWDGNGNHPKDINNANLSRVGNPGKNRSGDLLEKLTRSARECQALTVTTQNAVVAENHVDTLAIADHQLVLRRSTHAFPFKETPDGFLVVDPNQIAFESRKISVLVSDPHSNLPHLEFSTSTVIRSSQSSSSQSKNERILNEVKKAMSIPEPTDENRSKTFVPHLREMMQNKYSDSKKASEEFEKTILQRVVSARNADTHIVIGDKVFPCHSLVLETFSSYFDRLFRPPESVQKIQLPESEVSASAFPLIMNWILQPEEGRKSLLTKDNLVSVYAAAKHLSMTDLEEQCISFVEMKVEPSDPDLMQIWEQVKKRSASCPHLLKLIGGKIAASYQDIYKSRRYLEMDSDELFMLLGSNDIAIESEMDIYNSALSWLLHDWKNRRCHTNRMMSTVRFGLLSPLQLTQINLCPELNKIKNEKDYNQILCYGTVKTMLDDALAFSILGESYKSQPEELRRWMEKTGMRAPTPRTFLRSNNNNKSQEDQMASTETDSHSKLLTEQGSNKLSQSSSLSYTVLNEDNPPRPGTPIPEVDSARRRSRTRSRARRHTTASKTVEEISKPRLLENHSSGVINDGTDLPM